MSTIFVIANLILSLIVMIYNFKNYWTVRKENWSWIILAYAILGLLWAIVYSTTLAILYIPKVIVDEQLAQFITLTRPTMTLTLAVILANAIMRNRKSL